MLAPRDSKTRKILLGLIAQSLPDMTEDEMECWVQHPEGLPAVVAGLKSPPVSTGTQAPLHVASPRRQERVDSLPVAVVDVGGGRAATVTLLADVVFDKPRSMANGAEKSLDVYQLDHFDVNPMDQ